LLPLAANNSEHFFDDEDIHHCERQQAKTKSLKSLWFFAAAEERWNRII
jgi:hypothetical protein